MRHGLKLPMLSRVAAPVSADRSRCLSAFVAIARQGLPISLRYEPSHVLALAGICCLVAGFFADSFGRYGSTLILAGWGLLVIAYLALLSQDRLVFGKSRPRLIRQLDEVRRGVGLDHAILPESLEFLESTAQQWERIEHSLEAQTWRQQNALRARIYRAAHSAMEDIVVLECGTVHESGLGDEEADKTLAERAATLSQLADEVDATAQAITTYPREAFASSGAPADGVVPELERLEEILANLGQATSSAQTSSG